ncbi:orotidine-5'-phosphate decarboxylase [uncultured Akkermansia sp.]|uniref:orotidine-5'-phosphate decarboxylase n=3 Tax=Akkermansia TaxID=239934 RepID=UPI0026043B1C|nr:orotidine-5'-phosphate decarboxylase [uncultured Akkermansia sp.]
MIYKIPFTAVAEKSYLSFLAFGASSAWDLPACDDRGLMDVMSQSFTDKLAARIKETGSALCVGLDPRPGMDDLEAIPALLRKVVEETAPYAAAFKPNIAYFEAMGLRGLEILEDLLPDMPEDVPVVLDAKRGDIGETQKYYAHAYFERLGVDAVTLSPFMGYDTLEPFLDYEGKGIYLLAVTSNPGSADVERQELAGGRRVFELVGDMVLRSVREGCKTSVGMVVGLTNADSSILERIPDAPLLIPGLGAQGGDLSCLSGSGHVAPPLINVSRGIMYQNPELGFAEKAAGFAQRIREALNY